VRFLIVRALARLILFDLYLVRGNFNAVYQKVRNYPVAKTAYTQAVIDRVGYAMDMASIWYYKEIKCMQRSAATACLLRDVGVPAEMIIGSQQVPFKAHAWVEVEDRVVSDKPYMRELWAVVDHF
jgi:hypothetical protein